MGRYSEFQVTTGMELVSPESLMVDIAGIGEQVFEQYSAGPIRMWEGGRVITPKSSGLVCINPDKLKYYHLSLIAERIGKIPLEFLNIAVNLDPAFASEDQIGTENLRDSVAKKIFQKTSHCTLAGRIYAFDYLDVVDSAHFPDQKVFVLRQLDTSDSGSGELDIISDEALARLNDVAPTLTSEYGDLLKQTKVERSIPIAYTKQTDPSALTAFKETFTENLFDPVITFTATQLDISNKL